MPSNECEGAVRICFGCAIPFKIPRSGTQHRVAERASAGVMILCLAGAADVVLVVFTRVCGGVCVAHNRVNLWVFVWCEVPGGSDIDLVDVSGRFGLTPHG